MYNQDKEEESVDCGESEIMVKGEGGDKQGVGGGEKRKVKGVGVNLSDKLEFAHLFFQDF